MIEHNKLDHAAVLRPRISPKRENLLISRIPEKDDIADDCCSPYDYGTLYPRAVCVVEHSIIGLKQRVSHLDRKGSLEAMNGLKSFQTAAFVAIGWALLAAWADLFGHSPGFALPYSGLGSLGNMRIYWLVGLFALAAGMAAFPRWFDRAKRYAFYCIPILASFGTMAFAVAPQQGFFPAETIAVIGIVVAGTGYTWFTCLFCGMLAQTQRMSYAIASIVGSLALKTVLVQAVTLLLSDSFQVGLAILLPLIVTLFALFGERGCSTRVEDDERQPPHGSTAGYRYLIPQIVVAVIAVATTRVITPLGFFGDPLDLFSGAIPAALGALSVCAALIALGYLTLIRRNRAPLTTRFMPAFLVIIFAFFVSALSSTYPGILAAGAEVFITAVEALSHALFWTIAVTAIRLSDASPFRVVGLATGFYDLLSIVWVALFFSLGVVNNAVILAVSFVLVSLVIWLVDRGSPDELAGHQSPPSIDRRSDIADRFGLSPREREVFMMLAQGRSRSYISEELVVSEGTVKTHISHIYTKLGITNRQEMFDMLLDEKQAESSRQNP